MIDLADPALHHIPASTRPGPLVLSPSRWVWWTGRVAIGLRHQRPVQPFRERASERDAGFLQDLLLNV